MTTPSDRLALWAAFRYGDYERASAFLRVGDALRHRIMLKRKYGSSSGVAKRRQITKKRWLPANVVANRHVGVPRPWAPLPMRQYGTFRYHSNHLLNPGAGVCVDQVFSANGMYDPDITGTGHQPYGFDQMMANYDHYTVMGSRCIVEWTNTTALPVHAVIALRDSASSLTGTTTDTLLEQPGIKHKLSKAGSNVYHLEQKFSARKWYSNRNPPADPELKGSASANPFEQAYYHVMVCPQYSTDDPGATVVSVMIEYFALLSEPKILSPS